MKISQARLKQIIKEEIEKFIEGHDERYEYLDTYSSRKNRRRVEDEEGWEWDGRTGSSTYRRLKTKHRDADIDPMSGMPVPRSGGRPYDHDEEIDPMSGMPVYRKRERNPFK
jgi:hypothetical protein